MASKRPGYLTKYAQHARITKQAASVKLARVGIDYLQPFDFSEADRRIEAAAHADRVSGADLRYDPAEEDSAAEPPDGQDNPVFARHQARREMFKAKLAELEYLERIGELVSRKKVEEEWFRVTKLVCDGMRNIASRVAGPVSAESDQRKVKALLEMEINQALEALAKQRSYTEAA